MLTIVELDHECKRVRILLRRKRCKLRKYIVRHLLGIAIADIQNLIIDFCIANRKFVDALRNIWLTPGPTFPDLNIAMMMYNQNERVIILLNRKIFINIDAPEILTPQYSICAYSLSFIIDAINGERPLNIYREYAVDKRGYTLNGLVIAYLNRCVYG